MQVLNDATHRITAFHGDVLDFNMDTLFPRECVKSWEDTPPNTHIIGNLPFSVATPLIIQYMESIANRTGAWRYGRTKLTLTFQKEVAERMVAEINTDQRCRLSIVCQYLCHVNLKMVIQGEFVHPIYLRCYQICFSTDCCNITQGDKMECGDWKPDPMGNN